MIELLPKGRDDVAQLAVAFSVVAILVTDTWSQPVIAVGEPLAKKDTVPENARASLAVVAMVEVGATVAVRVTDCPSGAAVVADTVVVVPAAEIV